jgi:hypothetical protein
VRTCSLVRLFALIAPFASLAAGNAPGFPQPLKGSVDHAVAIADLNGRGELSVVATAGNKVVAFDLQGHRVKGYPFDLGSGEASAGDVAAADTDADGKAEVAVTTLSGKLFLLSGGEVVSGFPIQLPDAAEAGPSFADLDGDGQPELLQGDASGKLHAFKKTGAELPGFPVDLAEPLTSSASVGWLQGRVAIAVGGSRGSVFVLDAAGKALPGFPAMTHAGVTAPPAFADIDDDGKSDLVVASQDFHLYAWGERGQPLAGFPVACGMPIHGSPAVADLDGDGVLDVAFASTDGSLYAVNGKGEALPGFPVALGPALLGGVVIGDMNRDGTLDVLTSGSDGRLFAVSAKGKALPGFPRRVGTGELSTPALALTKAGTPLVFIGAHNGELSALEAAASPTHVPAVMPWPGSARDPARAGWFHPNPPRYKELALPRECRTGDTLSARWRFVAVDGATEPPFSIEWLRNGKGVKEMEGKDSLPPFTVKRGEHWSFHIHSGALVFKSPEATVLNTPPTSPLVHMEPEKPSRATGAKVLIDRPSEDADGDPLQYRVAWFLDGERTQVSGEEIRGDLLTKGRRLTAVVTVRDGMDEGPPVSAERIVADTAPTAAVVSLAPQAPRRGDTLSVHVAQPATDLDGDALTLRYRWQLNGQPLNYALDVAALPLSRFKKGDLLGASVTAFDGALEGPPMFLEARVVNTPPRAPQIAIDPPHPHAGDVLRVAVSSPAVDVDGDPVSYDARWSVDGKAAQDGLEVVGTKVKKGQKWTVTVQPSDGSASGPEAKASTEIENTAPGAPEVALCEGPVRFGSALEARVLSPAPDVDHDAVSYRYQWTVNGKPVPAWAQLSRIPERQVTKHQLVRVTVTPTDGLADGRNASAECRVENTPPTTPNIALEPKEPTAETGVSVRVVAPASDADGDAVNYRYAWTVDGVSIPQTSPMLPPRTLKQGQRVRVEVTASDGEAESPSVEASARVANTPPPAPVVTLSPSAPAVGEALRCSAQLPHEDIDGDALRVHRAWWRDGEPVAAAAEREALPQGWLRHGEKWACEAWSDDGQATSQHVRKEVATINSKPSAPVVKIERADGAGSSGLRCAIVQDALDPDGDGVTYRYAWARNGKPLQAGADPSLSPVSPGRGESVTCSVYASDGTQEGPAATAKWAFVNSAPHGARVSVRPLKPQPGQTLTCNVDEAAQDPDGDAVSYAFTWFKDGVEQPFAPSSVEVPSRLVHTGDIWSCQAQPTDGEASGPLAKSNEVAVLPAPQQALR